MKEFYLPAKPTPRPELNRESLPKEYRTSYRVDVNVDVELPHLRGVPPAALLESLQVHAAMRVRDEMAPWLHPSDIIRHLTRTTDTGLFGGTTALSFSSDVWKVHLTALPIGLLYTQHPAPATYEEWAGFDFVDWLEARDQDTAAFFDLDKVTRLIHWAAYKQDVGHQVGLVGIRDTQIFDVRLDVAREGAPYVGGLWLPVYGDLP